MLPNPRPYYYWIARGVDERPVRADRIRKSLGAENTFSADIFTFEAEKGMRVPAGDIEALVLDRLRALFSLRTDIGDALTPLDLEARAFDAALRNAFTLFKRWLPMPPVEMKSLVREIVERVAIAADRLDIWALRRWRALGCLPRPRCPAKALGRWTDHAARAIANSDIAQAVARHKGMFFSEKDAGGRPIDYGAAIAGGLRLVPEGAAHDLLADDYRRMIEDGLLLAEAESFDLLLQHCRDIEHQANVLKSGGRAVKPAEGPS